MQQQNLLRDFVVEVAEVVEVAPSSLSTIIKFCCARDKNSRNINSSTCHATMLRDKLSSKFHKQGLEFDFCCKCDALSSPKDRESF